MAAGVLTPAVVGGRFVWQQLDPDTWQPVSVASLPPAPPGPLDYPPGLGPGLGLVQGMTDGSETVRPLAQFGNPQGLTDDAPIINDSLLRCGFTRLQRGVYNIASPINRPPAAVLQGPAGSWANVGGQGTPAQPLAKLKLAASFAGLGAITILDQALGNWSTQNTGGGIRHVMVDGSAATTGALLYLAGPVWGLNLEDVCLFGGPAQGILTAGDATNYPSGQAAPYGIHANEMKIDTCAGNGAVLGNATDCQWQMVQIIGCAAGWVFNSGGDHRLSNCGAENCTGAGYSITAPVGVQLDNCRTNLNGGNGLQCSGAAGGTTEIVAVTGCRFNFDGQSGGGAGINVNNPGYPVHVTGSHVIANATGPATGFTSSGAAVPSLVVMGGEYGGVTAGWSTSLASPPLVNRGVVSNIAGVRSLIADNA